MSDERLGLPVPVYAHLPLATDARGEKLGKQTAAWPVSRRDPADVLLAALVFPGQRPPVELRDATRGEIVRRGIAHRLLDAVPKVRYIAFD